jgi:hypothetical protein
VAASRRATAAVLLAWCLLAIGDNAHAGYYNSAGLACVVVGFGLVLAVVATGTSLGIPDRVLFVVPAAVCIVEAIVEPTKGFLYLGGHDLHAIETLTIATAVLGSAALLTKGRVARVTWFALLASAATTGIVTIVVINNPKIDVWDILQQSSTGLVHGDDLYRQHWAHSTGLQAVYPYLPISTILVAPFRWLFGDVRFALLVASLVSAVLVRKLASREAAAVGALILMVPGFALLVNRSWTEPLLVAAFAALVVALRSDRPALAVVALAVALASKQHIVLLLPIFAVWPMFGLRRTIAASALAVVALLPWFIAGPRAMWHDAVHANLALGVRTDALDVPAVFARHGHVVGFWFTATLLAITYAVVLWRSPRTLAGLALSCGVVMWAFDLANKQTFFNHYTLPLGLLVVAVAAAQSQAQTAER